MEELKIDHISESPVKTLQKSESKKHFTLGILTSTLPLTTDQIFKIFDNNKESLINDLVESSSLQKLEVDRNCFHNSLRNGSTKMYNSRCKGCQILYRLTKKTQLEEDKIDIFNGRKKGQKIKLDSYNFFNTSLERVLKSEKIKTYLSREISLIYNDGSYLKNTEHYSIQNKWSNYVICNMIFNKIMKKEKCHLENNFIWCFVCGEKLTCLHREKEFKNIKSLTSNPYYSNFSSPISSKSIKKGISTDTCNYILKEIVIILHTLKNYEFVHSKPDINSLSFVSKKVTLKAKDSDLVFPLKVCLQLDCFSSITFEGKRFFYNNSREIRNSGLPVEDLDVHLNGSRNYIETNLMKDYSNIRILSYKIGKEKEKFLKLRNFSGVPVFHSSFDIVCFLTSLVLDACFYQTFQSDEKLMNTWRGLWKLQEYDKLMKDLDFLRYKNENNFGSIFEILKNYYIRVDASEYLYQTIL